MSEGIKKEEIKEALEAAVELAENNNANEDLTQIKTLQQMHVEAGQKVPEPLTPEQLDGQLLLDHHFGFTTVVPAFNKLGKNGMMRVFNAILQLPMKDMEVKLNGNMEKQIFLAAQKTLYSKSAIIFRRMAKESAMEAKATAETEKKRLQNIAITDNVSVESKDDGTINPVETASQTEEVIKI
jgi:alpha-D-ribose 1-methylphosphonate 5-triphosphate diphosphatase PhnM